METATAEDLSLEDGDALEVMLERESIVQLSRHPVPERFLPALRTHVPRSHCPEVGGL